VDDEKKTLFDVDKQQQHSEKYFPVLVLNPKGASMGTRVIVFWVALVIAFLVFASVYTSHSFLKQYAPSEFEYLAAFQLPVIQQQDDNSDPYSSFGLPTPNNCEVRDLSNYTMTRQIAEEKWSLKKSNGICNITEINNERLWFTCDHNQTRCNTHEETNYDGSLPPCCTHLMRDMIREFDRVMCYLKLEYFVSYGSLLGLERADRMLPWTEDVDFVVPTNSMAALLDLWEEASHLKHGFRKPFFSAIFRLNVNEEFAGGKLAKWKKTINNCNLIGPKALQPYADLFLGWPDEKNGKYFENVCVQPIEHVLPLQRKAYYKKSFKVSVPYKPSKLLATYYGPAWKEPPSKQHKKGHSTGNGCLLFKN